MTILADEYDTALREIRLRRMQLRAATKAAAESRDEAKRLAGELNKAREHLANARASNDEVSALAHRLVRDMSRLVQERDASRADAEALQAELGRVRAERDLTWQPIETAPRDGREVLVWTGRTWKIARWMENSVRRNGGWSGAVWLEPTHWIPLPERPEVSDE